MIQRNATTFWRFFRSTWKSLLFLATIAVVAEFIYKKINIQIIPMPLDQVGLFVTAMSIFLVFRVNESYERWWEARKLWGQLVNTSRSFGRQVITLIEAGPLVHQQLIYRQIAYVNALRIALRYSPRWNDAPEKWSEIVAFVEENELDGLKKAANIPCQLVRLHAQQLRQIFPATSVDHLLLCQMDTSLNTLYDIQGGCERIKNTVFPDRVAQFTRTCIWILAAALPFIILDASLDARQIMEIILVTFMSYVLVTIERLGRELKNPFHNKSNDTPMTALCRTIEIDLRQFLGETDLPSPIEGVDGVLM